MSDAPISPNLKLIHNAQTHQDVPLPGCERVPVWWVAKGGVQHNGTTVGVKFRCARCGFEGKGVFGPARDFAVTTSLALQEFVSTDEARDNCLAFVLPEAAGG
ncbi:hypothetical protein [Tateyamaria sp. Alg231-49]|uniref:hypothetical protein n=1 Tax=Tateyamaria sp. Alg231-49 TaxID=1922219 RepID=UPI000D555405|nr:hypothetical protein [Tateyamaria sp. Alg231-49]